MLIRYSYKKLPLLLLILFIGATFQQSIGQVVLRDSLLTWKHHDFSLNQDKSLALYDPATVVQDTFHAKVIENNLIRLVLVPEYGGRIISFIYKPTGHENLYQSACGSPYGINEGNFYYNWLMVYGGIFPTFPEPEHGKTWLLPWEYALVKEIGDTITISMEYTDTTAFSGAPGKFNNGITQITCRVEISVYKGSSAWDYDVYLINNQNQTVNYEYWTCTTLTPGCEIGETASPLNTEMVVPITQYKADWSPNSWIGSYGNLYDFSRINFLSKWNDMGIAYANNLNSNFWGVINHENNEGVFRISDNVETPGLKFWTWGKNNVDNNMFDFYNGGADNYIELWAGVSQSFFSDAHFPAQEAKVWKETFVPTVNMNQAVSMNNYGAVNIIWNESDQELGYELNAFKTNESYRLEFFLNQEEIIDLENGPLEVNLNGNKQTFDRKTMGIEPGAYQVHFNLFDGNETLVLQGEKNITVGSNVILHEENENYRIKNLANHNLQIDLQEESVYNISVYNTLGQKVYSAYSAGNSVIVPLSHQGVFVLVFESKFQHFSTKIVNQ